MLRGVQIRKLSVPDIFFLVPVPTTVFQYRCNLQLQAFFLGPLSSSGRNALRHYSNFSSWCSPIPVCAFLFTNSLIS